MAVQLLITNAGLDALVNAQGGSTEAIRVVSVGITQMPFTMAPTIDALPGEMKRLETISGKSVSETIVHMTAQDNSTDVYDLHGFGLYLTDGTLFAVYSQLTPIFRKVSIASLMLAMDIAFANGGTDSIEFGDTSFLLPPATETVKGVAEIATSEETAARSDPDRIVTPRTLGEQLAFERAESDADISALAEAFNALINALMARTITGSGLVTGGGDLLASRVLQVLAATAADIRAGTASDRAATPQALADTFGADIAALLARTVTGSGLVTGGGNLSADRVLQVLAATAADIRTGTATDKAATPQALADTFGADIAALLSRTVSGAGLVTGGGDLTSDRILQVLAASAAEVDAGTDGTKVVTPLALSGLIRLLAQNGYAKLPGLGGLIIQWGRFSAIANGTTTTVFPVAFPTACFSVVSAGGSQGNNDSQDNPPVVVASGIERSGFAVFSADDSAAICCYLAVGV